MFNSPIWVSCFTNTIKCEKQEQNKHDIGNGGDERRPSGGSGPSSLALHSLPTHSLFSTPHRGTNSNEWGLVTGGSERMEDHYPAPQHHPAHPNQLSYCENDRDVQGPQYTVVGGRGMNGRAIGQGKAEGGHSDEVRRGQTGMAKPKYGTGLPQMVSHQSYHQYHLSSSRPGQRDPGGTLASASPSAGSTGGIDKNGTIDRNGGRGPQEPYYKHAYRRAHDDEKGGGNGREMPQSPLSPPSRATSEHRIPPPSFWKSSASAPCTGGADDGLNNVIAHNQALLQRDDLYPSGAVRHCPAPNQDHDPLSRYAHQGASTNHSVRDTQDRIVHPRNPCEGWGSVSMVSGLQSQNMTAAGSGAPEIERHGYRNGRAKESRTPPPDPKRVYVRLCDLLERCGGNLDEVMVDPQTSAKLESILLGLKEKESRAKVGVCVERSQVGPLKLFGSNEASILISGVFYRFFIIPLHTGDVGSRPRFHFVHIGSWVTLI